MEKGPGMVPVRRLVATSEQRRDQARLEEGEVGGGSVGSQDWQCACWLLAGEGEAGVL